MTQRPRLSGRDLVLTLAVVAVWGYNFVPIKIALVEVPPFALAALRFFFAAVPVVFFVRRPLAGGLSGTFTGFLLVIAAALAWAVGNIIAKRGAGTHGADMFALVVWSSLVPPLPLAALSYAAEGGADVLRAVASMSITAWACVLFMAYGGTLFGYGSWNALLHRYPTPLISPFALLIPVFGLASGALFLGESLAPLQAVGALLVLAGLAINVYGRQFQAWLVARS